jgi:hypothetical protein
MGDTTRSEQSEQHVLAAVATAASALSQRRRVTDEG